MKILADCFPFFAFFFGLADGCLTAMKPGCDASYASVFVLIATGAVTGIENHNQKKARGEPNMSGWNYLAILLGVAIPFYFK